MCLAAKQSVWRSTSGTWATTWRRSSSESLFSGNGTTAGDSSAHSFVSIEVSFGAFIPIGGDSRWSFMAEVDRAGNGLAKDGNGLMWLESSQRWIWKRSKMKGGMSDECYCINGASTPIPQTTPRCQHIHRRMPLSIDRWSHSRGLPTEYIVALRHHVEWQRRATMMGYDDTRSMQSLRCSRRLPFPALSISLCYLGTDTVAFILSCSLRAERLLTALVIPEMTACQRICRYHCPASLRFPGWTSVTPSDGSLMAMIVVVTHPSPYRNHRQECT